MTASPPGWDPNAHGNQGGQYPPPQGPPPGQYGPPGQGQYGPPGWGPPPGGGPYPPPWGGQPPKKSNMPWLLGGGAFVVVLAVVLVLVFTVFTGGGKKNDTGSPKGAVQSLVNSLKDKDWSAAETVTTGDARQFVETLKNAPKSDSSTGDVSPSDVSFSVKNAKTDGDTATVDIEASYNGKNETTTFDVTKKDGKWLVSSLGGLSSGRSSTPSGGGSGSSSPDSGGGSATQEIPSGLPSSLPSGVPTNSDGKLCWPSAAGDRPVVVPSSIPDC